VPSSSHGLIGGPSAPRWLTRRDRLVELPREGCRVGSRFIVASEAECLFAVVFSKRGNVALYPVLNN
jgi:hypothetical protein